MPRCQELPAPQKPHLSLSGSTHDVVRFARWPESWFRRLRGCDFLFSQPHLRHKHGIIIPILCDSIQNHRHLSLIETFYNQDNPGGCNMAEMISGVAGGLQGSLTGMLNKGSDLLDRFMPPERRNELMAKISKFATEKPMMAVC